MHLHLFIQLSVKADDCVAHEYMQRYIHAYIYTFMDNAPLVRILSPRTLI